LGLLHISMVTLGSVLSFAKKLLRLSLKIQRHYIVWRLHIKNSQSTKKAKKSLIKAAKIKNTKAISELYEEVKKLLDDYNQKSKKLHKGIFNKIETTEHLYEDAQPEPPRKVKCPQCDEEHEEIQLARHIIKKHTEKKEFNPDDL